MRAVKIVVSSGHGKYIRGASCDEPWGLDEVDEARNVVAEVCNWLTLHGHDVEQLHDDVSTTQDANLKWIVSHHNAFSATDRLDVSIHFNAYVETSGARGTEVCYVSQDELAGQVSAAIAGASGLINRGAKYRSDLYFLNKTTGSLGAILIEVCFVDAAEDCRIYDLHFNDLCQAIAETIAPEGQWLPFRAIGKVSWFGGPDDMGVDDDEDLAFLYDVDDAPELFLNYQPTGTTGLARRLDPATNYIAMRWDYNQFSKEELASGNLMFMVRAPSTGKQYKARPADWGPHSDTSRVADISPGLMTALGIETDDEVEITLAAR